MRPAIARLPSQACTSDRTDETSTIRLPWPTLVRVLAEWKADVLFRISSLEPMDCTPEIVDLVASSPTAGAAFPPAAAARCGRDPASDAASVHGAGVRESDRENS